MVEDTDIRLPQVPDAEGPAAFVSTPDPDEVVPDLGTLLAGPEEVNTGSFLFSPGVIPATVLGYTAGGEGTLSSIEDVLRERANRTDKGKISKFDAFYAPQTPLPFGVWEYKCETCRFYQQPRGGRNGSPACEVVGHEEDWFGGESVHPEGWCALWMPEAGRGFFEYATDRLEGEASD